MATNARTIAEAIICPETMSEDIERTTGWDKKDVALLKDKAAVVLYDEVLVSVLGRSSSRPLIHQALMRTVQL